MNCEFCQSPVHIWFQCPKKPDGWKPARLAKKSTAERMDVQEQGLVEQQATGGLSSVSRASLRKLSDTAGTQALPVDTNPEQPKASLTLSSHGEFLPPSAGTGEDKDRQPKFDKVAYQREYMRKWRAARGKSA